MFARGGVAQVDRRTGRVAAAAALALLASACAGSSRFDGFGGSRPVASAPPAQQPLPPVEPIQTAPVQSAPLAPPPGTQGQAPPAMPGEVAPGDPFFSPELGTSTLDTGAPPPAPRSIETPIMQGGSGEIATLGQQPGSRPAVTSRHNVVGNWNAREATGGACRVLLSSSPAIDLYRASATGCANRDLQKVTAWDYRDGEVYLYQPGGSVAARLRVNDGTSLSGVVARSGASLSMSR